MEVLDLVGLDIVFPISDPPAQLEEPGTFAGPPPALKRTRAHAPAAGQLALVQVPDKHNVSPRSGSKIRGECRNELRKRSILRNGRETQDIRKSCVKRIRAEVRT